MLEKAVLEKALLEKAVLEKALFEKAVLEQAALLLAKYYWLFGTDQAVRRMLGTGDTIAL